MVYLVLDTNIWIYLANGFDGNKNHGKNHFNLLHNLMELISEGEICVLVNDLIIEEWKRNRKHALINIEKLENKLNNNSIFRELAQYIKSDLKNLKSDFEIGIKEEITANKIHINLLEQFLFSDCIKVPLTDEVKIKVFDHSTSNKAPFHNNKNNVADAAILYSLPIYFKEHFWKYGDSIIFVSNNTTEFTDNTDLDNFHPDIKAELGDFPIRFFRQLPTALKISSEIVEEIYAYNLNKKRPVSAFDCKMYFCNHEDLELNDDLSVSYQIEDIDPAQLSLFPNTSKKLRRRFVSATTCPECETIHYECPKCLEINPVNDWPDFSCYYCKSKLTLKYKSSGDFGLYVYS